MSATISPTQKPSCNGIRNVQILLLFVVVFIGAGFKLFVIQESSLEWLDPMQITFFTIFYWTCTAAQLPLGYLSHVAEGNTLNWVMRLSACFIVVMLPVARYISLVSVYVIYVIIAFMQVSIPVCIHKLIAAWVPPFERAQSGAFVYGGSSFSKMIIILSIMSIANSNSSLKSLIINFSILIYAMLIITFIWCLIYFFFGAESPSKHKCISQKEKEYIEESLRAESSDISYRTSIPLKEILTSLPVWAIIIAHCCQTWLQFVLTMIPSMQILRGAIWVATWEPNIMWLVGVFTGMLSDFAVKSGTSTALVRKICNTVGFCGPAISLVVLLYAKDEVWTIILFIAIGLNATSLCGFHINHIDLSPRYAGFLMAISSFFASIVNIIVFHTFSNFTEQWNTMLYSAIGTSIVGNVIFVVYGKAKVQHWNN